MDAAAMDADPNLAVLLADAGDDDRVLVTVAQTSSTAGELRASASDVAEHLVKAGLRPGQPVACLIGNSAASIASIFGIWKAGGVVASVNPRTTARELTALLDDVGAAAVVAADQPDTALLGAIGSRLLVTRETGARNASRWITQSGAVNATDALADGVALVMFTSGTTGRPKPVLLRHGSILAAIDAVLERLGATRATDRERPPNLLPIGLSLWSGIYNICFALRVGAPLIVMEHFDAGEFRAIIQKFGIKSSVLAPAMISMLLDDDTITDLAPLRIVRSIAAPLSPHLARKFHDRFGAVVLNGYGQTELGGEVIGWSARDSREFADTKLGSVGRPHPGIDVRILEETGVPVAPGELGEICVQSPFMMAGYLKAGDDDRIRDGFLRTGDLGRVDDDGFVWIEGRTSDLINRGGLKVFPAEVEEVLRSQPEVTDVAVAGIPDERLGEVPWAFVVLADRATLDDALDAALFERARAGLAPYKVPTKFVSLTELPRNDMGKVLRAPLIEHARRLRTERDDIHDDAGHEAGSKQR